MDDVESESSMSWWPAAGCLFEIIKLVLFLFLWLYCGIAFWTLIAWGMAVGVLIAAGVAVVCLCKKERQNKGHDDRG